MEKFDQKSFCTENVNPNRAFPIDIDFPKSFSPENVSISFEMFCQISFCSENVSAMSTYWSCWRSFITNRFVVKTFISFSKIVVRNHFIVKTCYFQVKHIVNQIRSNLQYRGFWVRWLRISGQFCKIQDGGTNMADKMFKSQPKWIEFGT